MLEQGGPISAGSSQLCREVTPPGVPREAAGQTSAVEGTCPSIQPATPGTCFFPPGLATITPWGMSRFLLSSVLGTRRRMTVSGWLGTQRHKTPGCRDTRQPCSLPDGLAQAMPCGGTPRSGASQLEGTVTRG